MLIRQFITNRFHYMNKEKALVAVSLCVYTFNLVFFGM